ncbi:DUF2793 domain-containing protein [Babesia caballi]|uniref:DUF2793 domain-containing protein n=1 Tax=Babesia caballi TaxID=5871 RepID=A0AAV4LQV3_BABCB|nr:DUF2793 domain-containing protein [Babesia caballi]
MAKGSPKGRGSVSRQATWLALLCTLASAGAAAEPDAAVLKERMLPITYPKHYDTYPMGLSYVPDVLPRSMVEKAQAKARGAAASRYDSSQGDKENEMHVKDDGITLQCNHTDMKLKLTDRDLTEITTKRRSKWNRYHLGNFYIDDKPIVHMWLENEEGVSLLAEGEKSRLVIKAAAGGDCDDVVVLKFVVRIPEPQVTREVTMNIDRKTGVPADLCGSTGCCSHVVAVDDGSYQAVQCSGEAYKKLEHNEAYETSKGNYRVVSQILVTMMGGCNSHALYTLLYGENQSIIALKRRVQLVGREYDLGDDDVVLFDRPVTKTSAANVFVRTDTEWDLPRVYPQQAGSVTVDENEVAMVTILPFGTLERPPYLLNEVYYMFNGMHRSLVIPTLQSRTGLYLLSEDVPGYAVTRALTNEGLEIQAVYNVEIPGTWNSQQVAVRFKVANEQIMLLAYDEEHPEVVRVQPACLEDIPLGTEAQCIVQQFTVGDGAKGNVVMYTFLYDTKLRHLKAVAHRIRENEGGQGAFDAVPVDAFDQVPAYASTATIKINQNGDIDLPQAYTGYVSESLSALKWRAIVMPQGMVNPPLKYTNAFTFQGVTLVTVYLEAENGVCLVDTALQPTVSTKSEGTVESVRITYYLLLPEYSTPHSVTLDFECRPANTGDRGRRPGVAITSKYLRYRHDTDVCVMDASVWTERTESFGGKRALGVGEKAVTVITSRLIRDQSNSGRGFFYKFLYDPERAVLFCKMVPVLGTDNNVGKSCRWVRHGEDVTYDYSVGGITSTAREVWARAERDS